MTTRSYSDLSDSATTFDPEEQFDRDIDERMKGMSKEDAVARAIVARRELPENIEINWDAFLSDARAAIAAADKWDAEEALITVPKSVMAAAIFVDHPPMTGIEKSTISPGLDSAIQDELDHPPASIMEEGK